MGGFRQEEDDVWAAGSLKEWLEMHPKKSKLVKCPPWLPQLKGKRKAIQHNCLQVIDAPVVVQEKPVCEAQVDHIMNISVDSSSSAELDQTHQTSIKPTVASLPVQKKFPP